MKKRVRDHLMKFYVSGEESKLIDEKMHQAGISNKSAFLRKMAIDGYVILQDFEALKKVTYELNKIGVNINQIAKVVNTYSANELMQSEIKQLQKELRKIWQSLSLTD